MRLASKLLISAGGCLTWAVAFGLLFVGCAYVLWPGFELLYKREVWDWYLALQAVVQVLAGLLILYGCDGLACSISAILFARLNEKAFGKVEG